MPKKIKTRDEMIEDASWVYDFYKKAKEEVKDEDLWAFVIPSYKRGHDAKTIDLACSDGKVKVYLFIYEFDIPNYQHYLDKYKNLELIVCKGFKGIVPKRNFINEEMLRRGHKRIYVVDDDVSCVKLGYPGTTKDGERYTTVRKDVAISDFLKVWQYSTENVYDKNKHKFNDGTDMEWGMSGLIHTNSAAFVALHDGQEKVVNKNIAQLIFFIALDLEKIAEKNLKYNDMGTWDDMDLEMRILESGYTCLINTFLSASTDTMTSANSVTREGDTIDLPLRNSVNLQKTWGTHYVKQKYIRTNNNARINWRRVRKDFEQTKTIDRTKSDPTEDYINELRAKGLYDFENNCPLEKPKPKLKKGKPYDYLVVGAGLSGAMFTQRAIEAGKKVLVVDKRDHIGGNCADEDIKGINVHKYGAHIVYTSDKEVWDYLNRFTEFNNFMNSPMAKIGDELYNLPFNMNTFNKVFGAQTPQQAKDWINKEIMKYNKPHPQNLEEKAINLVGKTVYEMFIKGYTEKQWGRKCRDLPQFIIERIPVRYTYNNNYYFSKYQGVPKDGYCNMISKMLKGATVLTNRNYLDEKEFLESKADKVVYTGPLDELYNYEHGILEYRSLKFEHKSFESNDLQGVAVINHCEAEVSYTRSIEHKHFNGAETDETIITYEYPQEWDKTKERYYPINDEKNCEIFDKYKEKAKEDENLITCGRLADYSYYSMEMTVRRMLNLFEDINK